MHAVQKYRMEQEFFLNFEKWKCILPEQLFDDEKTLIITQNAMFVGNQ